MSFAANMALKIGCIVIIIAACVAVMSGLSSILSNVSVAFEGSITSFVAQALGVGRQILNNFIPGKLFNLCVVAWFTAYPICAGLYLAQMVQNRFFQS